MDFKKYYELTEAVKNIPKENQNGDCYVVSYKYFNSNCFKNKNLRLVHGLVSGQGALKGIIYCHAWCEDGETIIDMTLPPKIQKELPKGLYYAIGHIKTTFEYDYNQVNENAQKFGTYGPWEEVLIKNKY